MPNRRLIGSSTIRRLSRLDPRRALLFASIAGGLLVPLYFFVLAPTTYLGWDFHAYYAAASAALTGSSFVGVDTGITGVTYVYPPPSVLVFLPLAPVENWLVAFALQSVVNVAAALGVAALVVHVVERQRGRLPSSDRLLITGCCVGSAPVAASLGLGQVDTLVALALASAFLALEYGRESAAGTLLGAAALVKMFPAALGVWLLYRRAWRALAAATATGVTGLAVGAVLFGVDSYRRFLTVLASRSRLDAFAETVSPNFFAMSLSRPLSQLLPPVPPVTYIVVSVLLVTPVLWRAANSGATVADRLATFLAFLTAILVVSPASNTTYVLYLYFPVLCLFYLDTGRHQPLLFAGFAALSFPIQPAQVSAVLAAAGTPTAVQQSVSAVATSSLTVVSVPLLGCLSILAWCGARGFDTAQTRHSGAVSKADD
ncbi:glycosyltransferase family 87 protein [Halobacterium jilantaiense]|uniref:DUF2029 domain-containing protein n=1 Tax=Halobacterium jilantaiense TaxID=355548 RepID=A0A1I0MX21_9EURY|nr:glycosyltransferase family 87 protein [Halobacterium jilantaiense]SEV93310.1 Protein of unknown function [Halobacterium jilantaiense]